MGDLERALGRCPFACVGEWLEVLERWATDADGGILYEAAAKTEAEWRAAKWRAASGLPRGRSRWFVEVYRIDAIRLHDLATIQIVGAGTRCPKHDTSTSYCQSECELRRAAFALRWDRAYLGRARAHAYRCNPWVWVLHVRRYDRDGMARARASMPS